MRNQTIQCPFCVATNPNVSQIPDLISHLQIHELRLEQKKHFRNTKQKGTGKIYPISFFFSLIFFF